MLFGLDNSREHPWQRLGGDALGAAGQGARGVPSPLGASKTPKHGNNQVSVSSAIGKQCGLVIQGSDTQP